MGRIFGVLLFFVVIFVDFGYVYSVHRNTPDVKNGQAGNHAHTSGDHHDHGALNTISDPQFTGNQFTSRVKLPGEDGNNSPFPVIHRLPGALPDSIRGSSVVNLEPGPGRGVGEPPVTFLNRERSQRRNLGFGDGSGAIRAPSGVRPATFEQPSIFSGAGSPFAGQATPPPFYDSRLSPVNGFPDPSRPFMTSFPSTGAPGFPGYPGPGGNPMMAGGRDYSALLAQIDAMLDQVPPELRRNLIRSRRMRRRQRIRNLLDMASAQLGIPRVNVR